MCLVHFIGGAFKQQPEELHDRIGPLTSDLIKRAFDDIDPARLVDYHTHIAGIGTSPGGAFINPKMRSWAHPFHHLKFTVYLSAAGVADVADADTQLVRRLVNLVRNISNHGKHRLLAFDKHYIQRSARHGASAATAPRRGAP